MSTLIYSGKSRPVFRKGKEGRGRRPLCQILRVLRLLEEFGTFSHAALGGMEKRWFFYGEEDRKKTQSSEKSKKRFSSRVLEVTWGGVLVMGACYRHSGHVSKEVGDKRQGR